MMHLKKYKFALCSLFLVLASCQNNESNQDQAKEEATILTESEPSPPEETIGFTLPFYLEYLPNIDRFELVENKDTHPLKAEEISLVLNAKYPEIQLKIESQRSDTLFVSIPESTSLTQSIGTTGATSYLIEATYGFTFIDGINVVDFSFEEGDHAVPGPYTRESFTEFFK